MAALSSRRTSWRLPPIRSDRVSRADAAGSLAEVERKLFMTCYRLCVMACVCAAVTAGLASAQEEGGTGPQAPGGGAVTSYQMKPVALIQSGVANAMEATPLEFDGVLFVDTASNLVHAYDAVTGEQLWSY